MIEFVKFIHLVKDEDLTKNMRIAKGQNKIPTNIKELIKWLRKG